MGKKRRLFQNGTAAVEAYRFARRPNRKAATIANRVVKWPRLKGSGLGGASDETEVRSYELPARALPRGH